MVIAVFYTQEISITSLLIALVTLGIAVGLNLSGVRKTLPYALLGIGLWFAFSQSGVHATVAGILLAFTIPARSRMHRREFAEKVNNVLDEFPQSGRKIMYVEERERKSLAQVNYYINEIKTPLQRMEDALHPVAVIGIIPLFALANAGVRFTGGAGPDLMNPVTLGVILGLVFGKQIGITLFAWLAVKLQIAALPENVALKQIYGVSCIAGIGYTMSLFIANLAFPEQQLVDAAKIGILFASVVAAGLGIAVLACQKNRPNT